MFLSLQVQYQPANSTLTTDSYECQNYGFVGIFVFNIESKLKKNPIVFCQIVCVHLIGPLTSIANISICVQHRNIYQVF